MVKFEIIKTAIFLTFLAFFHAKWEVQIEGKDGWAKNLPCWRLNVFFRKLLGGKPLTGYHAYMMCIFLMLFHAMFLFETWSLGRELVLLGMVMWYFVLEDAIWFIVNPHYTIKKFTQHDIEWHKRWIGPLPLSYWVSGVLGGFLLWFGYSLLY